jgi:hypothetical protein
VELDKETGNTLEEGMMNVENVGKVDAFDNKDTGKNEDDDGESFEEKDAEGVSNDEIRNSSEEEAGFKDTSENAFDSEVTDEKPKNTDEKPEDTMYMEYEVGIKVHLGRELSMIKKPEKRDVMDSIIDAVRLNVYKKPDMREEMLKTNPKGKEDENVNVDHVMNKSIMREEDEEPEKKDVVGDSNTEA